MLLRYTDSALSPASMSRSSFQTCFVLGVPVHVPIAVDSQPSLPHYLRWLQHRITAAQGTHVMTCNAEMVMLARRDPDFADLLHQADLITPDGAGVVWALGRQQVSVSRTPGIELAEALIGSASDHHWRLAFVGGAEAVADQVTQRWQQTYPQLSLISHHGYFNRDQEAEWLRQLQDYQPDLVLVGLGVPRQEYWIQQQRSLLPQATWIGVGGSFDIWAGIKTRAPQWLRDRQLEWLYRLYREPWRWRRMLALPHFAWQVLRSS